MQMKKYIFISKRLKPHKRSMKTHFDGCQDDNYHTGLRNPRLERKHPWLAEGHEGGNKEHETWGEQRVSVKAQRPEAA